MKIPDRLLDYSWTLIKFWLCIARESDRDGVLLASWNEISDNVGISIPDMLRYKEELEALGLYPIKGILPSSGLANNNLI